jgi:RHS repeat-associated protein
LTWLPLFPKKPYAVKNGVFSADVNVTLKFFNPGIVKEHKEPKKNFSKKNDDRFIRDEAGRIVRIISKDKGDTEIVYNEYGKLESKNRSNIETEHYFYDKLGRIIRIEYKSGNEKELVKFKYSTPEESYIPGNITGKNENNEQSFYKYIGRRLKEENKKIRGHEFVVKYKYNEKGLLSDIHYPSGLIVSYKYDIKNEIENIFATINNKKKSVLKFIRDKDSMTSLEYGNGLTTAFQQNIENGTIQMKTGDTQDLVFFFNEKALINKVIDKKVPRNKKEFFYDAEGRLITAYGPWGKIIYRYDSMDNLTTKIEKDCKMDIFYSKKSGQIIELKENGKNIAVKYDRLGRMIQYGEMSFIYNTRGRLEKILKDNEVLVVFYYNYKNHRVMENSGNEEFYYIYDNQDRVLGKYDNKGDVLKEYIYSIDIPYGYMKDNQIYYYHYDLMNFPIEISDENGKIARKVQYKPYGEIISLEGEEDSLRFPGQFEIFETDIYYNLNRIYFYKLGKYLDPDPSLINENLYSYSKCNPIMFSDFRGLEPNGKIHYYRSLLADNKDDPNENSVVITFVTKSIGALGGIAGTIESEDCFTIDNEEYYLWGTFKGGFVGGSVSIGLPFTRLRWEMKFESITEKYDRPTIRDFSPGWGIFGDKNIRFKSNDVTGLVTLEIGNVMKTWMRFIPKNIFEKIPSFGSTHVWGRVLSSSELILPGDCEDAYYEKK